MIQVAGRFDGPSGVDSVVLSLPTRISEAMFTMMDNMETINSKVRAHIGTHIQLTKPYKLLILHRIQRRVHEKDVI